MIVTWTVPEPHDAYPGSVIYYNHLDFETQSSKAEIEEFIDHRTKYNTYRCLLGNLKPNLRYSKRLKPGPRIQNQIKIFDFPLGYRILLNDFKSKLYQFETAPAEEWLPRFAIYGDLGYVNERSLPYLKQDVLLNHSIDAIFHLGDLAYDLPDQNGWRGHNFMRSIESIASRVPYMVCPGNHEQLNNFSHYDSRFSMLGNDCCYEQKNDDDDDRNRSLRERLNNHFHSWNIGPAHIIMFSTEFYYYTEYGWDQIRIQYEWLERDLKEAQKNRKKYPWIITMGHRPLYCLKLFDSSCSYLTLERKTIRSGIEWRLNTTERSYGLEELFYRYGVDLQFYGHEHFYGRLLPLFNYTVLSGKSSKNPYDHPLGPVHITTGSAGNQEYHPPFNHLPEWVGSHHSDYGYTRLIFENKFRIRLQQISDDQNGKIIDEIEIIKSSSKPKWMKAIE
ncbi:iron/zinc purple acid phosphatase-like protein 1 [Sarcoptes scabiei]|uniref:Iron/zinc purple acid phosphatase-like protein 1 n=1 Tax=Sarcoptes scabiei TaxID=52283 RepID=A0A132ABF5_SARSC|nr:iron/zinc purple acid phosphatase-like protein 1 [Sarcoptes scabiei]